MNFSQDKNDILDTIGTYLSIGKNSRRKKKRNSIETNNKNDIIPFLLDLLTVAIGSVVLYRLVGDLIINIVRKSNPIITDAVKNNLLTYNSSDELPSWFVSGGLTLPISRIDIFKILKNSNTDSVGNLYYKPGMFNYLAYQAIKNPGDEIQFNNIFITYNESSDTFLIKPVSNTTIEVFFNALYSGDIIYDKSVTSFAFDNIFGTITKSSNKSREEIYSDRKNNLILDKLMNESENLTLTPYDLEIIDRESDGLYGGGNLVDIGCGIISTTLELSTLTGISDTIISSNDPEEIGSTIDQAVSDTFGDVDTSEFGGISVAKDSFFKRFIYYIQLTLLKDSILSPQVKLGMLLSYSFKNNGNINSSNSDDDYDEFKNIIKCIVLEIKGLFNEFLYLILKKEIQKILVTVQKKIINEKFNNYIRILKSLISW